MICGRLLAMPRLMIKAFVDMGIEVRAHAWGMTEMSPIVPVGTLQPQFGASHRRGQAHDVLQTQGYPPFMVEMKISDDAGKICRGTARRSGRPERKAAPRFPKAYFRVDTDILDHDGYFDTGDAVATIDTNGYMRITDRLRGCDQVGRRMDLVDRAGKPRGGAPQGAGSGGDRRSSSEMGRAPAVDHDAQKPEQARHATTS